jgi:hypothetical protein
MKIVKINENILNFVTSNMPNRWHTPTSMPLKLKHNHYKLVLSSNLIIFFSFHSDFRKLDLHRSERDAIVAPGLPGLPQTKRELHRRPPSRRQPEGLREHPQKRLPRWRLKSGQAWRRFQRWQFKSFGGKISYPGRTRKKI